MSSFLKPLLITMGDPAGIGPEVIVSSLHKQRNKFKAIIIGCPNVIERAINITGIKSKLKILSTLNDAKFEPGFIEILKIKDLEPLPKFGLANKVCGNSSFEAIKLAIKYALKNETSGIVTGPICKESLSLANINFPGHTEILAKYSGSQYYGMLLVNNEIKVLLSTIHCSLSNAIKKLTYTSQIKNIRLAHQGAITLGCKKPRIAVAGLNPHAGEGGLFGNEEKKIIIPAIKAAQKEGFDVSGPWPGDTIFLKAREGNFDIVIAQYHDQGLIPIKYMGLDSGVNITLGLPFVRTSPDHGTAFDIAGKAIANSSSFEKAIEYANYLYNNKINENS